MDHVTLCSATLGEDGKREPPLGPLYIASAFESVGVAVDFRDAQLAVSLDCTSGEGLADFLKGHANVVAISCFVDMLPAVVHAAQLLVARKPGTRVILGGPGPSGSARRLVDLYPWIHGVVQGEGEETIKDWVRWNREGAPTARPIPGLVHRVRSRIVDGGQRARVHNLSDVALPAYHLLD